MSNVCPKCGAKEVTNNYHIKHDHPDWIVYECMSTQEGDYFRENHQCVENQLAIALAILRDLVRREPVEACHVMCTLTCVFCNQSKDDCGDDEIEHTPDCLITRAKNYLKENI